MTTRRPCATLKSPTAAPTRAWGRSPSSKRCVRTRPRPPPQCAKSTTSRPPANALCSATTRRWRKPQRSQWRSSAGGSAPSPRRVALLEAAEALAGPRHTEAQTALGLMRGYAWVPSAEATVADALSAAPRLHRICGWKRGALLALAMVQRPPHAHLRSESPRFERARTLARRAGDPYTEGSCGGSSRRAAALRRRSRNAPRRRASRWRYASASARSSSRARTMLGVAAYDRGTVRHQPRAQQGRARPRTRARRPARRRDRLARPRALVPGHRHLPRARPAARRPPDHAPESGDAFGEMNTLYNMGNPRARGAATPTRP